MIWIAAVIGFIVGAAVVGFVVYSKFRIAAETWKTKYELSHETAESQKQQVTQMQQQLTMQFENLAQKIFDEKTQKFDDQNTKQLTSLLNPLKERIQEFEKKVSDTYSTERYERGQLKGEIAKLIELNQTMSKEAQNLATALKGENKTQGNWGELILENILERSGLRKGEEFFTQETVRGPDGEMLRPDVIVKLPDGKHLIVDSKMTLVAYEACISCENPTEKEKYAQAHVESLHRHVKELSDKRYHLAEQIISPDFVMLFMPVEPAFAMAFKLKPDLFATAWDRNIAIVSPTTLLATLRTVSSLWKQERQQRNALDIAKRGGELYDKFAGIVKDFEALGDRIESVSKLHNDISSRMSTGRGNLISQVEKLKELGAKAEKSLPQLAE